MDFKGAQHINPRAYDKNCSWDNKFILEYIHGMCVLLITHIPNVTFTVDKNVLLKCIGKMSLQASVAAKWQLFSLGQSNNS